MPRPGLQLGRGAAVALATFCFFIGVMAMPLADATAIQFTSPILTALLAPLVLGERTPPGDLGRDPARLRRSAGRASAQSDRDRPRRLFPLGAAFGMSWLMMLNRMTAGAAPVMVMQFLLAAVAAPLLVARGRRPFTSPACRDSGRPSAPTSVLKCLGGRALRDSRPHPHLRRGGAGERLGGGADDLRPAARRGRPRLALVRRCARIATCGGADHRSIAGVARG